jgi:hypothetical protein
VLTSLGVTDQAQWSSGLDPGAAGQLPDHGGVDRRVGLKEDSSNRFGRGNPASRMRRSARLRVQSSHSAITHQLRQEPEVGHLFALGGRRDLGEAVPDGGQRQHAAAPARSPRSRPARWRCAGAS